MTDADYLIGWLKRRIGVVTASVHKQMIRLRSAARPLSAVWRCLSKQTALSNSFQFVLLSGVTILATACGTESDAKSSYSAEVRRTSYGIPHIIAKNEAGLGYGIGYAYAQDNFCRLAEEIVTINGERSKYFGPDTDNGSDVLQGTRKTTNLNSDFFFKLLNDSETVDIVWTSQPADVQQLIEGYVAGVNRYLAETGQNGLPEACRDKPWVRPLRREDLIRLMRRYAVLIGSLDFIDEIVRASPPTVGSAALECGRQCRPTVGVGPVEDVPNLGSNAVALGRQATINGRGLLLANPHFPWEGILRFYQLHLTIPGELNAMGAALPGLPVINIGFTENFAWSHTVNTSAHYTLHALQLDENDPTRYRVGDKWFEMAQRTAVIEVVRDGRQATVSRTYWSSIYGPLIERPGEFDWNATTAFALSDANAGNGRLLQAWYGINRARSLDELERSVKSVLGLPWVNTLAADKAGNALYLNVSVVPNVPEEKRHSCIDPEYEQLWEQGTFVLDGADPNCAWDTDPDSPQAGTFSGDALPVLRRTDFVQNSNDSAWMTNPAVPLTGFPSIVSRENIPQNGRTRRGVSQIRERLAGSDGLPGNKFSLRLLQTVAFNNKIYFGALLPGLRNLCNDTAPVRVGDSSVDVALACATMTRWDGTANSDSVGFPLFKAWWDELSEIPGIWSVPFSPKEPMNTPRELKSDDPAVVREARSALARAILSLHETGTDWTRPWGELHFVERRGERIGLHGGATSGLYNAMVSVPDGDGHYIVRFGASYVLTVGFADSGPEADAVLAYSQSTDPQSPHFADQTKVFAENRWIRQAFTEEQIKEDPDYSVISISE